MNPDSYTSYMLTAVSWFAGGSYFTAQACLVSAMTCARVSGRPNAKLRYQWAKACWSAVEELRCASEAVPQ